MNTFDVHSPADGRVVETVDEHSASDVSAFVAKLRLNQPAWEQMGVAGRVAWMEDFRDWLLDHDDDIARILQAETGKPWAEAVAEVPFIADVINYYCDHAAEFLAEQRPRPHGALTRNKRLALSYRPHPVVGVIAPWNFPLVLAFIDAVPALLAGAAVVLKPSEITPLSTLEMVRGWNEDLGAPAVLQCATGLGDTGAAVVEEVDFVQFTGSTGTGRKIAQRCAERLIPYSLELGGKDAMIVLADADLERAANGAVWGSMANAGQVCISVERCYVEAPVYDDFVGSIVEKVGKLRVGIDDQSYRADIGPLATPAQQEIVQRHVDDAVAKGAKALTGGKRGDLGNFFEPTVLVDVDHTMACMREETFGPTLPVMKVADVDEAIRLANDSPYGLSATVWTRDRNKADLVSRQLEAGTVNVNDAFINLFTFPLPHAGWKESGVGARLGGSHGMRKYCRTQAVTHSRIAARSEPLWFPYSKRKIGAVRRTMRFLAARDMRRRIRRPK